MRFVGASLLFLPSRIMGFKKSFGTTCLSLQSICVCAAYERKPIPVALPHRGVIARLGPLLGSRAVSRTGLSRPLSLELPSSRHTALVRRMIGPCQQSIARQVALREGLPYAHRFPDTVSLSMLITAPPLAFVRYRLRNHPRGRSPDLPSATLASWPAAATSTSWSAAATWADFVPCT